MSVRLSALTLVGLGALLAGCSAIPFVGDRSRPAPPPAPLAAAPAGSVSAAPLAPPPGIATPSQPSQPSGLAALNPDGRTGAGGATPAPAATPPSSPTPAAAPTAASGVDVGRTDLLGGWTINAAGESCQLFMTLTTWSGGYRASTRGCKNAELQKISAWNLEGKQVQLLNDSNTTVARLFAASKTQYNGQGEGGGPVSVSR